jgi:hypothetical protein
MKSPYEIERGIAEAKIKKSNRIFFIVLIAIILFMALFPYPIKWLMLGVVIFLIYLYGLDESSSRDIRGEIEFSRSLGEECIDCGHDFYSDCETKEEKLNVPIFPGNYRRCKECEAKYGVYKPKL